jgi:uncharacterized membrane protein YfcA
VHLTRDLLGFLAGLVVATVTTPVGVSGAVFLLPVQLTVLDVPSPRITPTNLLFNVFSTPGALARYLRSARLDTELVRRITVGSAPGVVLGAFLRVHLVPDAHTFRLVAALVLLPSGILILWRTGPRVAGLSPPVLTALAFAVGTVGGLYGIGGGSLLAPILVGAGMSVVAVAPAALACTFLTSLVGVVAYAGLALGATAQVSPDWHLGIACGLGGLLGGALGARLQPHVPDRQLRDALGILAICLSVAYVVEALA